MKTARDRRRIRFGGTLIEDECPQREAFNIMLSMPRGSADPLIAQVSRL
jgi:hypothetical protein